MTGLRRAAAAAVASAAFLALLLPLSRAQMVSPLQGQGRPNNSTRDVFFSMHLDRLLDVDDRKYRFSGIYFVTLTWNDSEAWYTIQNNTALMRSGQRACAYECTDWGRGVACCDDIFLPSVWFRNAFAFSQDRPTGYKIWALPPPDTTVMWLSVVQGEFFQQMNLKRYPFDSFELGIATEVLDTAEPPHPGLNYYLSASGAQRYMYGVGDDVSDWTVTKIAVSGKMKSNESVLFQLSSPDPSHPLDPLPLSTGKASATITPLVPGGTRRSQLPITMLFIKVTVSRNWSYHVLNTILPVTLLAWMSFVVFVLPRKELATRLGVAVTLFLALAAVQFVVTADQPSSSYILPTQQQILCTYSLLLIMAVEAIVVCMIETYKERQQNAEKQRQARQRYLACCKAVQELERQVHERQQHQKDLAAAGGLEAAAAAPAPGPHAAGAEHPAAPELHPQPSADLMNAVSGSFSMNGANGRHGSVDSAIGSQGYEQPGRAGLRRRLTRLSALSKRAALVDLRAVLQDDDYYCAWLAQRVDTVCAIFLFIAYNVAVILIYTLQSGYTDLLVGWEDSFGAAEI